MASFTPLNDTLFTIQEKLTRYVYPLWLIFGITGCLLNIFIFSQRKLRNTSCSMYFLAASIDHLFTLIIGIGPALYSLNHPDPQLTSLWFCKLRGYLFQICLMLSRWFVTFASIDRYVLSSDDVFQRNLATKKNSYRIILGIIIVWSIICSHRLIFYETDGHRCGILSNMPAAMYHSIYVIIGGGLLPSIIMILSASLINRNLFHKEQRRMRMSVRERRRNSLDQQVYRLLFTQIIFYVCITIPQLCNLVFNAVTLTMINPSDECLALQGFLNFIAEFILYLFPVTSFYLYTLTSRTFRLELWKYLLNYFQSRHQVNPTVRIVTLNNST